MDSLKHPNIVQLYCTFQDAEHLCIRVTYVCDYQSRLYIRVLSKRRTPRSNKKGMRLAVIVKCYKAGRFDERGTKFYAAELILAVEHMHSLGILHRDIKPGISLYSIHNHQPNIKRISCLIQRCTVNCRILVHLRKLEMRKTLE